MSHLPRRSPRNHPPSTAPDPAARRRQKVSMRLATQALRNTASQPSRPAAEPTAALASEKHTAIQELSSSNTQNQPIADTGPQSEITSRPSLKRRSAPDLGSAQCLDRPPTFKRVRLSLYDYCVPFEDGSWYDHASPSALAVRRMAQEAETHRLRETVNRLTQENEHLSIQHENKEQMQNSLLELNLERASLQRQVLELQEQNNRIEAEARSAMEQLRKEHTDQEMDKNASVADLQRARDEAEIARRDQDANVADLLRQVQVAKEAHLQAEQEHDAAAAKASEQIPSRDASAEFELNEKIVTMATEKQQLRDAVEAAQASSDEYMRKANESDADRQKLEAEIDTLKSEFERWRGQTMPPTVTPRGQITPPPVEPKEPKMHPLDYKLMTSAPDLYNHMRADMKAEREREAQMPPRHDAVSVEDRIIADNWQKRIEESNKIREKHHEEYTAAQKDFEAGRYDMLPIGTMLHDFREKNWVSFSKGPDGRIRRSAVYDVQLEYENTSVHILPFKGNKWVTRRSNGLYATACLNAQSPELQAAAAEEFLSEDEYNNFMDRSFGADWPSLDLSNAGMEAEAWQQIIHDLRRSKRFKTACRMWAAGEPALSRVRCWPPTFLSMEKTQACTHFNDEDERTRIEMSCLPGREQETVQPFYIDEPRA